MYKPDDPTQWGLGGDRNAINTYDTEPFSGIDQAPAAEEDYPLTFPPRRPGRCQIVCVTPTWQRRRRGLVVKHGDGWLDKMVCPACGERAQIEFTRPVRECGTCDGAGHVPHEQEEAEWQPGAIRAGLMEAISYLRFRTPKET